jgi:hypothetical protein
MHVDDFETYAASVGLTVKRITVNAQTYLQLQGIRIDGGAHDGEACEVAVLRTMESPWAPQAAVHVKPHLVKMGEKASQASPVGEEWQYLSRRFDKTATPKNFLAHILTVLGET